MARKGHTKVIYKGTFVSIQSLLDDDQITHSSQSLANAACMVWRVKVYTKSQVSFFFEACIMAKGHMNNELEQLYDYINCFSIIYYL